MTRITANAEELMKQASMTAHDYFLSAIKSIDDHFGVGYAKNNPELIAAFMQVAARDFHTAISSQAVRQGAEQIAEAITSSSD